MFSQDEETLEHKLPIYFPAHLDLILDDHIRRSHPEWQSATVPDVLFLLRLANVQVDVPRRSIGKRPRDR